MDDRDPDFDQRDSEAPGCDQSDHAILVLITADWIRRKASEVLSTRRAIRA
jgi:hypothetical protein